MALAAVKELQMRAQLAQMQLRWLSMLSRWRVWTDRRHAQSKTWRHTSSERFGNEEDAYGGDHVNTSVDDLLGGTFASFAATSVSVKVVKGMQAARGPGKIVSWSFMNFGLFTIFLLHMYWFGMIIKIGTYYRQTGQARDLQSNLSSMDFGDKKRS